LLCARASIPFISIPAAFAALIVFDVGVVALFKLLMMLVLGVLMFSLLIDVKLGSEVVNCQLLEPVRQRLLAF
jgi:hypothetical protein